MTDRSRQRTHNRPRSVIQDLSSLTLYDKDGLTIEEAIETGLWGLNATHRIGIAASTEFGLSKKRYPIRVIIADGFNDNRLDKATETCVSYWIVCDATNQRLPFKARPFSSETPIANLYRFCPDFDNMLWTHNEACIANPENSKEDLDPNLTAQTDLIFQTLSLVEPTDEQKVTLVDTITQVINTCTAQNRIAYIKVDNDYFIKAIPCGQAIRAHNNMIYEFSLTILANRTALEARNPTVGMGVITMAAYAIGVIFRYGLAESHKYQEFITVVCNPVAGQANRFTVTQVDHPIGYDVPEVLTVGRELDASKIKISEKLINESTSIVFLSGLMHYMFEHTTGGKRVKGPMFTAMDTFGLMSKNMTHQEQEAITTVLYEALRTVNKRAIANILIPTAKVYTHGKMRGFNRYERFKFDSFAEIQKRAYPSGSRKAYACIQALQKVIESGLSPFLPWAGEMLTVAERCGDILRLGARAHVDAAYYTGLPPASQAYNLDAYLPELASFMQTFHANDSLSRSRHLSIEVAATAVFTWTNLLRELKSKAVYGADASVVGAAERSHAKKFLARTRIGASGFNPADESTWDAAAHANAQHLQAINNIFK